MKVNELTYDFIMEAFKNTKGHRNPVVVLDDGFTYVLGIGRNDRNFTDVITIEEMNENINKICIDPSITSYSVVTPEYYNNSVKRLQNFNWIGEWISSYNGKQIKFGYGRADFVEKYLIIK